MTKFRSYLCEALADLIFFIFFYVIAVMLMFYIARSALDIMQLALMVIPYCFLFFLRMKKRNFFLFGFCHLALILIPLYAVDDIFPKLVYGALTVVFIVYSYTIYFKDEARELSFLLIFFISAVFTVFNILSARSGFKAGQTLTLSGEICIILMFYLFIHISNVDSTLHMITRSTVQPVEKIIKSSNRIILMFIIISGLILVLSQYIIIDGLLKAIGMGIIFLIRLIFRGEAETPAEEIETIRSNSSGMDLSALGERETSVLWKYLEILLQIIFYPALVFFIIFIIYKAVKNFYMRFYAKSEKGQDEKEFITPEVFSYRTWGRALSGAIAPGNRIRRVFYKKVKAYAAAKKIDINKSDTAYELTQKIKTYEDINDILKKYEQVRYGEGREK